MAVIVKLSKPVMHGDNEIAELELREPTIEDVEAFGYPFLLVPSGNNSGLSVQVGVVVNYAARLSGYPPSVIRKVSLADLSKLQEAVLGFFGDEAATSPT